MHCSCNSACSHNPLLMCVLPTTTTSVISRHLRKHNIFTQDSFVDHLQRAFVSTHAKPRNVEVIDWVWDFDAWFEPHLDSAYGGMSNYKSFRLLKQAALGEEQQDDRGDVSTVLQAKRYMTSDKATYFPPTPPHAQSSESVLRALQLQFEQLCMAATSAGGQLLDVSQLREGWAKAVSGGRVPPHGERPNPVPAAGTAGETDRLPLPPAVVGAAGSPLLVCRVLFTEPEVSNLKPAPFKQLGLWDSENENVNVPKKLVDWKKKGGFFCGKGEFLPPAVCSCNEQRPVTALGDSCMCGAEPHDFMEVVESAFKHHGSWRKVLQQRSDIAAYISELALVDFKNSIMATVRSVALGDSEVEKWWLTFLTHKIRSRVEYVVGNETPKFSWPRKFRSGSPLPTTAQNVEPRVGGGVGGTENRSTEGGSENCSSTDSVVASHTRPVLVQTLSFSGHGKSFISNQLAKHGLRDAASIRRSERLGTRPPDLAVNAFVWVRVDKGDEDTCVFHLGQVTEAWSADKPCSNGKSVVELWGGPEAMVSIRWLYRLKKGDYNSKFTYLVDKSKKRVGYDEVVRESIEVDSLTMQQTGGGNKSTSPFSLTKEDIQKIVDAGIGLKLDGKKKTKMVYDRKDDPCKVVDDDLLDELTDEDASYVDSYLRRASEKVDEDETVVLLSFHNGTDEEKIGRENRIGVGLRDIARCQDRAILNDVIVNVYFQLLQQRNFRQRAGAAATQAGGGGAGGRGVGGGQIWCLPSYFYSTGSVRTSFAKLVATKKSLSSRFFANHRIFFPINKNDNHWVLVVACLSSQSMFMYDSLLKPSEHKRAKQTLFTNLEAQLRELGIIDNGEEGRWTYEIPSVPQQSNVVDCGIYMCIFADAVSEGRVPPTSLRDTDITRARRRLLLRILRLKA